MVCLSVETYSSGKSAGCRMEILVMQRPWNTLMASHDSQRVYEAGWLWQRSQHSKLQEGGFSLSDGAACLKHSRWEEEVEEDEEEEGRCGGEGMRRIRRRTANKHRHHKVSNGAKKYWIKYAFFYVLASDYHEARTQKYVAHAHACTHRNAHTTTSSFPQESRFPDPVSCLLSVHLTSNFRLVGTFFCWLLLSSCSV